MIEVAFSVLGEPRPKGSTRSFAYKKKSTGKIGVATFSDNEKTLRPWMDAAGWAATQASKGQKAAPGVPVEVEVTFRLPRPKSHFNAKGELKTSAPHYSTKKPDIDKLQRALLDAMKGVLWHDDAQVAIIRAYKTYTSGSPSTSVTVRWGWS